MTTNPVIEKKAKAPRKAAPKLKSEAKVESTVELTAEPKIEAKAEVPKVIRLRMQLSEDAEKGEVSVNEQVVPLGRTDFQLIYALAYLQAKSDDLVGIDQLMQTVRELFPRFETPASVRTTGQAAHEQAFEAKLEQLLATLEIDPGSNSGRRWRHLLLSQARRYAGGQDTMERYELISELKQHRDLLGMMVQRFEQMGQLPPLGSAPARLHRFFVPESAALESERRLAGYVSEHLDQVRQTLSKALVAVGQEIDDPIITGKDDIIDWTDGTVDGYRLSPGVALEMLSTPAIVPAATVAKAIPAAAVSPASATIVDDLEIPEAASVPLASI